MTIRRSHRIAARPVSFADVTGRIVRTSRGIVRACKCEHPTDDSGPQNEDRFMRFATRFVRPDALIFSIVSLFWLTGCGSNSTSTVTTPTTTTTATVTTDTFTGSIDQNGT